MKKKILVKSLAAMLSVSLLFNTNSYASSVNIDDGIETVETSGDMNDNDYDEVIIEDEDNSDEVITEENMLVEEELSDDDNEIDETQTDIVDDTIIYQSNYIDDKIEVPSVANQFSSNKTSLFKMAQEMPSSYSSKVKLPSVRDQGIWGVCWSFAAIGAAEASIISKGLANSSINLSEFQLAYFFYNSVADPLGNTAGDKTKSLESHYLDQGGNNAFTTFALASWVGAADESKAPYETASLTKQLNLELAYDDSYHMQNAYWINMRDDANEVKKMVMEHGAVATSFYTDQTTTNGRTASYNPDTYSYYYDGAYMTNHAVLIVGWDDDYSISNFNSTRQPSRKGAWLVRNSWGNRFGDNGYFWISYDDAAFNSDYSTAYVFDFESASNYDHNYQYDGASGIYSYGVYSGGSMANVFTASGNSNGNAEAIEAVAFALNDVNVNYSIDIYTNITNASDPTSGKKALSRPITGSTTYVGYYTVPLEESVIVKEGDTYSIVVTLSKADGSPTYFFGDYSYTNGGWIQFTSNTAPGQSFRKYGDGFAWMDLNENGVVARVKAFTSDTQVGESTEYSEIPDVVYPTSISLNQSSIALKVGNGTNLTATISPSNTTDKSIVWKSSNTDVATVDSNGKVLAKSVGTATISATTVNGKVASCIVSVSKVKDVSPVLATGIKIHSSSITIAPGESSKLSATITPSNVTDKSIMWKSSNSNVFTVDSNGVVLGKGLGTATLTASTQNGKSSQISVTVKLKKVSNVTSDSKSDSKIRLKWDSQSSVSGYEVYRYNTSKKKYVKIATTKTNTYTDKKLSSGSSYKYKVVSFIKANKKTTYGPYSSILTASTKTKKPTLSISSTSKKAKLKWTKPTGVSGYEIYMSTNKSKGYTKVKTVNKAKTTSYTKTKLKSKKTYYFKVRTYRVVNGKKVYSEYSKVQKIKIK